MSHGPIQPDHPTHPVPPECREIADALDALGEHDRGTPDSGFEQRLLDAVGPAIAPEPIRMDRARAPMIWKPIAAAACVLLAAGAVYTLVPAPRATQTTPSIADQTRVALEEDINAYEELGALSESLETSIAELDLLTDAMDTELTLPSVFVELNADTSATGSL